MLPVTSAILWPPWAAFPPSSSLLSKLEEMTSSPIDSWKPSNAIKSEAWQEMHFKGKKRQILEIPCGLVIPFISQRSTDLVGTCSCQLCLCRMCWAPGIDQTGEAMPDLHSLRPCSLVTYTIFLVLTWKQSFVSLTSPRTCMFCFR